MSGSYAKQKLYEALEILVGDGRIDGRLSETMRPLGQLTGPKPNVVPRAIADELDAVLAQLRQAPVIDRRGNDAFRRQISSEDGETLARRILSMFVEVMGGL